MEQKRQTLAFFRARTAKGTWTVVERSGGTTDTPPTYRVIAEVRTMQAARAICRILREDHRAAQQEWLNKMTAEFGHCSQ